MFLDDAILVLNKPSGMSSFFAVNLVKKILGAKKAGHMGTLDPLADGVLVIGLNNATKLFDKFLNQDKEYVSKFKFGVQTDTLDLDGKVEYEKKCLVTKQELEQALKKFIGKQKQYPPIYSAKKVNGQRACDLARKGKEIKLEPKEIEIYNLDIIKEYGDNLFDVKINCSSGTYVRSIVRDVANDLDTYGMVYSITRTRCGVLCLKNSYTLEQLRNGDFKTININEFLQEE